MSKIYGKVCMVTGGGSGIGRSLCEALVTAGARGIYVVDIKAKAAKEVADHLPSLANHPSFHAEFGVADVGKEEDIKRMILQACEIFDTIDVYFGNAGIPTIGGVSDQEVSNEAWDKSWRVNVLSHIYAARYLLPLWKEQRRSGTFVITASSAGLSLLPVSLPYSVTKHAAISVADWIAVTHAEDGVTVHCICPSFVRTNMLTKAGWEKMLEGKTRYRMLDPSDVANATIQGIEAGSFLILPHPEVKKHFLTRAADYDRWIKAMIQEKKHFDTMLRGESRTRSKL